MDNKEKLFLASPSGAKAYLEFLRNLTPQILLLAFAVVATRKLDTKIVDLSNIKQTTPYLFFMGMFLLAFLHNCWLFISNLKAHHEFIFKDAKKGFFARIIAAPVKYLFAFFEIALCYLILSFLLLLLVYAGTAQGVTLLNLFFGKPA